MELTFGLKPDGIVLTGGLTAAFPQFTSPLGNFLVRGLREGGKGR